LVLLRTLTVLLGSLPVTAIADGCFHFDIPNFTLQGRVTRGERQTAPGQETKDDRDYHWYLKFTTPICVSGKGNDTVNGSLQTEIWPDARSPSLGSLDGLTLRVTGHFLPTYNPHYHAYLIFVLESVEIAEQVPPNKRWKGPLWMVNWLGGREWGLCARLARPILLHGPSTFALDGAFGERVISRRAALRALCAVALGVATLELISLIDRLPYSEARVFWRDTLSMPGGIVAFIVVSDGVHGQSPMLWVWSAILGNLAFYSVLWWLVLKMTARIRLRSTDVPEWSDNLG
jgi:hypothetical protein